MLLCQYSLCPNLASQSNLALKFEVSRLLSCSRRGPFRLLFSWHHHGRMDGHDRLSHMHRQNVDPSPPPRVHPPLRPSWRLRCRRRAQQLCSQNRDGEQRPGSGSIFCRRRIRRSVLSASSPSLPFGFMSVSRVPLRPQFRSESQSHRKGNGKHTTRVRATFDCTMTNRK